MSGGRAWGLAFLTGMVAFIATSLAALLPIVVAVFLAATGLFERRLTGVSGVLVGFGSLWTWFVGWSLSYGSTYDSPPIALAVGVVPLVVGLAIGAAALVRND